MALERCPDCGKIPEFCLCADLSAVEHRTRVLILQHPQEKRENLATAPLVKSVLKNCTVKIGLSWPSLGKVIGDPAVVARNWAVFFLGSGLTPEAAKQPGLYEVRKKNLILLEKLTIEGIVLLDGTWKQAKTLWWRNAWLLKLQRWVVAPERASLYGNLRKEPKREALSSLESVALALGSLEPESQAPQALLSAMKLMVARARK